MATIKTKVPGFTGIRAGVHFKNGVGITNDRHLIDWFIQHGYEVDKTYSGGIPVKYEREFKEPPKPLEEMTAKELREYIKSIGFGNEMGPLKNRDRLIELAHYAIADCKEKLEKEGASDGDTGTSD